MNPYQDHTDTDLISLLIQGDEKAFETIYRRYASELYRYAGKNIPSKEDCEEIIQDVFESLWARHQELHHVTALNAYLYRMVKYKVIRYFQHSKVKKTYADHYRLFEAVYNTQEEGVGDSAAFQEMLEKGLARLPERCQMAIRLRLKENLSNTEIAERMSITKATVENYMVTAVSQLRTIIPKLYKPG